MERFNEQRVLEQLADVRVLLACAGVGAAHARVHCGHLLEFHTGCVACRARWAAAVVADDIERVALEMGVVFAAAGDAVAIVRRALTESGCAGCLECSDVLQELSEMAW